MEVLIYIFIDAKRIRIELKDNNKIPNRTEREKNTK